jgi:hypothetical protein
MDRYRWTLEDGKKAEILLSPHGDNVINKYENGIAIEGAFLMDCGVLGIMPHIMRYCFEQDVNLRGRDFLRELHCNTSGIDELRLMADFRIPLRKDYGPVRSDNSRLFIYSTPDRFGDFISFDPKDVPEFVEGNIRVLNPAIVGNAMERCAQVVCYYHQCLDKGILKK